MAKTDYLQIRIDPADHERIKRAAQDQDVTVSQYGRRAIRTCLKRDEIEKLRQEALEGKQI
jgi:predicted HicB family RNase H-like nuclease